MSNGFARPTYWAGLGLGRLLISQGAFASTHRPGACYVPNPRGGYRVEPNDAPLIRAGLSHGQCIVGDGDVYNRQGRLILSHRGGTVS